MANSLKLVTYTGSSLSANTSATVYTVPSLTTTIIIGFNISNLLDAESLITVNIENNDGDNITYVKDVPIPTRSSIEVMSGNKLIMNTGDILKIKSNADNSFDACISLVEQT